MEKNNEFKVVPLATEVADEQMMIQEIHNKFEEAQTAKNDQPLKELIKETEEQIRTSDIDIKGNYLQSFRQICDELLKRLDAKRNPKGELATPNKQDVGVVYNKLLNLKKDNQLGSNFELDKNIELRSKCLAVLGEEGFTKVAQNLNRAVLANNREAATNLLSMLTFMLDYWRNKEKDLKEATPLNDKNKKLENENQLISLSSLINSAKTLINSDRIKKLQA